MHHAMKFLPKSAAAKSARGPDENPLLDIKKFSSETRVLYLAAPDQLLLIMPPVALPSHRPARKLDRRSLADDLCVPHTQRSAHRLRLLGGPCPRP